MRVAIEVRKATTTFVTVRQRVVRGASGGIVENGHPDSREQVFTTGTEMTLAQALAAGVAVVDDSGAVVGAYVEPIPVPEPPDDDDGGQVGPAPTVRRVKAPAAKPKAKAKGKAKSKAKAKAKAK